MEYIIAFVSGGILCVIGQLLLDVLKLSPIHIMSLFVVFGVILDGFGLYDHFIEFAGAGATVPILSLGHSFMHQALKEAKEHGIIGLGMGISSSISISILFAFIIAIIFKPKG